MASGDLPLGMDRQRTIILIQQEAWLSSSCSRYAVWLSKSINMAITFDQNTSNRIHQSKPSKYLIDSIIVSCLDGRS